MLRPDPAPSDLPRPEYPRPRFVRRTWENLNGAWTFAFDLADEGDALDYPKREGFDDTIRIPFAPESELSGVAHTGFIPALWYHRELTLPDGWAGRRVLLHFGGVDFEATVYLDGERVGHHVGGATGWTVDLGHRLEPGRAHHLVVHVRDDVRSRKQPAGKQSRERDSYHVYYTRVTGIWQTVWMEPVPDRTLRDAYVRPDVHAGRFVVEPLYDAVAPGRRIVATLRDGLDGPALARAEAAAAHGLTLELAPPSPRLWQPDDPHLYGIEFELVEADGTTVDRAATYGGLREVSVDGDRILLNGEPFYHRFVLDQGYWPDGIWTAPSDDALVRDIELARDLGFNGARLHQKVFDPRYHWHADRLGWLTWGEMPSWGFDENDPVPARTFLSEWREVLLRDRSHPSILVWTPLNETEFVTVSEEHRRLLRDAYKLARALDPTRPVNDASGWVHALTDLWTVHLYTQDPEELAEQVATDPPFRNQPDFEPPYEGQPYLVDEFGGIKWDPEKHEGAWGYGDAPKTLEAFYVRLEGLVDALLESDRVVGYCYTQLTDVEQECNGLYTYERHEKFDAARLRAIFERDPEGYGTPTPAATKRTPTREAEAAADR